MDGRNNLELRSHLAGPPTDEPLLRTGEAGHDLLVELEEPEDPEFLREVLGDNFRVEGVLVDDDDPIEVLVVG